MSKRNFHDCRRNRKALAWREGQSLGPMREQMPPTKAGSGKNVQLTCVPVDLRAYVSSWTRKERREFIMGPLGSGKTFASCQKIITLMNELDAPKDKRLQPYI